MPPLRIVHVSDVHVWRFAINPSRLFSKRLVGLAALAIGRARRFRRERLENVVARVRDLAPDHILITGDLTTTALPLEFHAAREALAPWLDDPSRVTILPGNHDRYTKGAALENRFERTFGAFAGGDDYPWFRRIDDRTWILGLDPTRPGWSARGRLPEAQLRSASKLLEEHNRPGDRRIIACHYPIEAPGPFRAALRPKRMTNAGAVGDWLATIGPHLYCCGHVHRAWAFRPAPPLQNQLCLNAGAPLLRDRKGDNPPGFLEIILDGDDVRVTHHFWNGRYWAARTLSSVAGFFDRGYDGTRARPRDSCSHG